MRVFSGEEVRAGLDRIDVVGAVGAAITGDARPAAVLPVQSYLEWPTPSGSRARSIALHAWTGGARPTPGVKIINSNPANVERGVPRASGLTLLFDPESAVVSAVMPAEDISAARTAAVSTLAVLHCGGVERRTLALVGCGPVGDWHVRLLSERCASLRELVVFDRAPERAATFVDRWNTLLPGWKVWAAADARTAVGEGDVVITATTTRTPYLGSDWIRRGATIVNVSLDDLQDRVFMECDRLLVDDWASIVADTHRLLGTLARAGRIVGPGDACPAGARRVDGTIGQLLSGEVAGRQSDDEVVVVNPFGTAVGDIALAAAVAAGAANERASPRSASTS